MVLFLVSWFPPSLLSLLLALSLSVSSSSAANLAPSDDRIAEAAPLIKMLSLAPGGHADWIALVKRTRGRWVDPARAFFPAIVPKGPRLPIVYPFGGGDLIGALATFPDAEEITTMSLEAAGDIGAFAAGTNASLRARFLKAFGWLLTNAHSKTIVMGKLSGRDVPGQLMFWFAALAILDYEPVSLKYFALEPDGRIVYLPKPARGARGATHDNCELGFRKRGEPHAATSYYRHIRANLDDKHIPAGLLAHLKSKGKVTAMTKAASYLLWDSGFSRIRDYLLAHTDWMISDSTGVPPRIAAAAGFEQITYGAFTGPCIGAPAGDVKAFRELWASQPKRELPFRYGYPDARRFNHLLITRRQVGAPATR